MAYHLFFPKVSSNRAVPACFHIVCASICLIIEFSRCKRGFVSPIFSNIYSAALQRKGGHFELDFLFICSQPFCCNDASLVWYLSRGAHGMDQGYEMKHGVQAEGRRLGFRGVSWKARRKEFSRTGQSCHLQLGCSFNVEGEELKKRK